MLSWQTMLSVNLMLLIIAHMKDHKELSMVTFCIKSLTQTNSKEEQNEDQCSKCNNPLLKLFVSFSNN